MLLLVALALLQACSLSQHRPSFDATETHTLLKGQQALLNMHAARLDALSQSQEVLLGELTSLQQQMVALNEQISLQTKQLTQASTQTPRVVREVVQQPRKPVMEMSGKAVIGRVEYVWLESAGKYLKARVDTGAKSSSLNAANIQPFERDGNRWVRFDVVLQDKKIKSLEAPLVSNVRIRQAGEEELERRPVVKLRVRLGELDEETDFTLADREDMLYPILLGRSFLQDIAVVDVARKFTRKRDPRLSVKVPAPKATPKATSVPKPTVLPSPTSAPTP